MCDLSGGFVVVVVVGGFDAEVEAVVVVVVGVGSELDMVGVMGE